MKTGNPKSVRYTLMNLSNKEGLPFQQVLTRYLHERLLYRLSVSKYKSIFILKGGNLVYAMEGLHIRPTMDIDILAKNISNDKETLKDIFRSICSIVYEDDCVTFDTQNISVSDIAEEKKYSGIRLVIKTYFDTVIQNMQIDIGFGDIVSPEPLTLSYPTLLEGLNSPVILAYSIETVIAEKFETMIFLGIYNSRMKDFFDVYILLKNNEIAFDSLRSAILQTFNQRNTRFVENHPLFTAGFYEDNIRQMLWKVFLRKIKYTEVLEFSVVINSIIKRLQPIYLEHFLPSL